MSQHGPPFERHTHTPPVNPLNPAQIDKVLESYPGEKKKKGWLSFIWDWASVVPNIIFGFWGVRDAVIVPMVEKVCEMLVKRMSSAMTLDGRA